jgi:hypothetical protein
LIWKIKNAATFCQTSIHQTTPCQKDKGHDNITALYPFIWPNDILPIVIWPIVIWLINLHSIVIWLIVIWPIAIWFIFFRPIVILPIFI